MARTVAELNLEKLLAQAQPNIQQGLQTENQLLRTGETAGGLAQRFLQGNVNVPVPVDERETIEANRTNAIKLARGLQSGGMQRMAEIAANTQAASSSALSQRSASDRLFNKLNTPISTPLTTAAITGQSNLVAQQFADLARREARKQAERDAEDAQYGALIGEVFTSDVLDDLISIFF